MKLQYLFLLTALFFQLFCGTSKKTMELKEQAKSLFGTIPTAMPITQNKPQNGTQPEPQIDTAELIFLGQELYNEKALSVNNQQSCGSCHVLSNNGFGVDNLPVSPGALGKNGERNTPTVLNSGFHFVQFWDGRAKDLKEQAMGPILNPIEMGMPNAKAVETKIGAMPKYKELFAKAFTGNKNPVTFENLAVAISAFERTLRTSDRFDDFINGDLKALTKEELKGLDLFIQTGCTSCHNGPLLGGQMYRKMGLVNAYSNLNDLGRFKVTNKEEDKFVFKVPSLRNISKTAPYFHDGSSKSLKDAVTQMAWLQLGVKIEEKNADAIVAFLGSLTDKKRVGLK